MNKNQIKVRVKLAGFVDRKMLTADFELMAPEGVSLKKLLSLADKSGAYPGKTMKKVLGLPRPPTILVNGASIDLPEDLKMTIKDGDEVAVMTPVAGG